MPPFTDGLSPNECRAARFLNADGWTHNDLKSFLMVSNTTLHRHLNDECGCPPLSEPEEPGSVEPSLIKHRRNLLGMSQRDLADAVGVRASAVSQWERGEAVPRVGHMCRVAEVLKLNA